ncbi:MAG: OmpA family protein [Stenotrophobium sp.]
MKYRSGLLAVLLSLAVALPVFAQDATTGDASTPDASASTPAADSGAATPAADTGAAPADASAVVVPSADSSTAAPAADASGAAAPAAADTSAAPAADAGTAAAAPDTSAAAPATDASAPATDTSAAPAADAGTAAASTDTSTPAADSGSAPAADTSSEPATTDTSSVSTDTSSSSSSDNGGGGGGSDNGGGSSHASSPIPGREYYVSPMFSYVIADKARGTKHGIGGIMTVGKKMTDGLNLEITGIYESFKPNGEAKSEGYNSTFSLSGIGLGAMLFPLSSLPDLYGLVNVSYGTGRTLPGPIPNYHTTIFDTGIGYLYPITHRILLRAEARFRMDADFREEAGIHQGQKSAFYDGVFNIGLLIPLGTVAAPPPPPPEPVAVVAAPPPPPALKCPNTAAGIPVGADGCPLDSDGDGVPDYLDECPHTPAGAKVMANGCALAGDCRTPKAGEAVDANGCAANSSFILKGVNFDFDSDRLTEDSKDILNHVADTLKSYPDVNVEVSGYTDDVGSAPYNLALSERRARSVKQYLIGQQVAAERMTTVGYGKTRPLVDGTTAEDRAKNRRVELNVK